MPAADPPPHKPSAEAREAILRAIEAELRAVIWMQDLRSQRVLYASQAYETLWGRPLENLLENPADWMEAILPEDRPAVEAAFERLCRGEPYDQEYRIALADGTQRWIHDRATLLVDSQEHPACAVGIARDVTDEKRVWERLRSAVLAADRAEEAERKLFASDLHDSVGQLLPLARMKLDALLEGEPSRPEGAAEDLRSLLSQAEEQVRTLIFQFSPVRVEEEEGLAPAMEQLAARVRERYGLQVAVRDDGLEKPLDDDRAGVLLRGVRELLINVSKHARTDKAEIGLAREGEFVVVTVEDGGVGFDPATPRTTGFGLLGLRDRMEGLGGRLEIVSGPDRGAVVRLFMPILA